MHDLREVGKITSTYGLKGAFKIESYLDSVEQFYELDSIYVFGFIEPFKINEIKIKKNSCFISLADINSITESEKLVGLSIYIDKNFVFNKEENEYYHSDLIGMEVFYNDIKAGTVSDIIKGNVQDILLIVNNGNEAMVPFIREFVLDINLEERKIALNIIEGLIPWL